MYNWQNKRFYHADARFMCFYTWNVARIIVTLWIQYAACIGMDWWLNNVVYVTGVSRPFRHSLLTETRRVQSRVERSSTHRRWESHGEIRIYISSPVDEQYNGLTTNDICRVLSLTFFIFMFSLIFTLFIHLFSLERPNFRRNVTWSIWSTVLAICSVPIVWRPPTTRRYDRAQIMVVR